MRPYLLWMSSGAAGPVSNIFGENRQYDVAYHDYAPAIQPHLRESEYYYVETGEKLNIAAKVLPEFFPERYRAIAFLDDDLSFDTDALNRAFLAGDVLGLDLWQPALTCGSYSSHSFLYQQLRGVRQVPFVEVMMPFFSKRIVQDALQTFSINESGWGLDCYMWPMLAEAYVLDSIAFGHYRKPERRDRVLRNGLTCWQELWIQQTIHDPVRAPFYPPDYKRPIE